MLKCTWYSANVFSPIILSCWLSQKTALQASGSLKCSAQSPEGSTLNWTCSLRSMWENVLLGSGWTICTLGWLETLNLSHRYRVWWTCLDGWMDSGRILDGLLTPTMCKLNEGLSHKTTACRQKPFWDCWLIHSKMTVLKHSALIICGPGFTNWSDQITGWCYFVCVKTIVRNSHHSVSQNTMENNVMLKTSSVQLPRPAVLISDFQ